MIKRLRRVVGRGRKRLGTCIFIAFKLSGFKTRATHVAECIAVLRIIGVFADWIFYIH